VRKRGPDARELWLREREEEIIAYLKAQGA
jgi:hypothetical protein